MINAALFVLATSTQQHSVINHQVSQVHDVW